MKYTGPKVKLSRKLGFSLTTKARKYMDRKPYPPGQHGPLKRRGKLSDYGRQLLEKQRLRLQYNVHERQMRNYFAEASRMAGNTGDNLIQLLESRLDALVYRAGFAPTIYAARQYVRHGHIEVNGKRVDIPSYRVKPNDVIQVREKSRKLECFQNAIRTAQPVPYLEVSKADLSAKYLYLPPREEVPVVCEVPLVVEYYSR
ncbi:MAG: 30S ribosomal protein S4 [Bacteroidota bacterium]|nr:30S ribosomal protein S4 [Candidatus Kapabacteria bacterium]MCS7301873.1 30S ribosomal protein S4 [Candidatus Kapabacteria bacterium]MCX7936126.1 30S ribosomal protein S4 [Chlorobiota bacterium]MDW8074980.1 30S ribosomal protein S4 [Bacteroidota bacterium]MDW8271619.1 30S ribosomal protein S4 [Bacteroidota bacterium]